MPDGDQVVVAEGRSCVIIAARDASGSYPVVDFLDSLKADKANRQHHAGIMRLIERYAQEGRIMNREQFKILEGTDPKLLEFKKFQVRVFGFFGGRGLVVLTHGCIKKSQRLSPDEVSRAHRIRSEHLQRLG